MRTALLAVGLLGCASEGGGEGPGTFVVSRLEGLGSSRSALTQTASFDLGDLPATDDYYFQIQNGGGAAITGISITSDNAAFVVSPASIASLEPGTATGTVPIVRVTVVHGLSANGLGFADLLAGGSASGAITLAGVSAGDPVELTIDLSVEAQLMDIDLLDDGTAVDLTDPSQSSGTALGGLGFIRGYDVSAAGPLEIHNTGNVTIEIDFLYDESAPSIATTSVAAGDTVPWEFETAATNGIACLRGGAVTNNDRLQLGDDGAAYFRVVRPEVVTPE